MSPVCAQDGALAAEEDSAVTEAALRYERVLRDGALQRYERARAAYEAACIAHERRRLARESHDFTQAHLTRAVDHIRAIVNHTSPADRGSSVRESTVSAAALFVSAVHYDKAEQRLRALVAQELRYQDVRRSAPSAGAPESWKDSAREPGTSLLSCSRSHSSDSGAACAVAPEVAWSLRPLLYLAATPLSHTSRVRDGQQQSLFSRLACAQRLASARVEGTGSATARLRVATLTGHRKQVEEARAAYADATAMQRGVTARMYELHQWLDRRAPVHPKWGTYVDAGTCEAVKQRIRSELAAGHVTLLRLLCESGPAAFDEEGRLRLDA